jgi:Transposase DDE domain
VWFTDAAIAGWRAEPRTTQGGQSNYSSLAVLTALTLRAAFRQTEGLIGSVIRLLGLTLAVPDHTTLCRRSETPVVPRPRLSPGAEPVHLLVDSTGLKLCGAGAWLIEKHGTRTRRSWREMHIGVNADTGQIVAAALTTNNVDDGSQVGLLLDQMAGPVASLTGDGAYDQGQVYGSVAGGHPDAAGIVPPCSTGVPGETALPATSHARLRLRTAIPRRQRSAPKSSHRGLTPGFAAVPPRRRQEAEDAQAAPRHALRDDAGAIPSEMGPADQLSDGGPGLCGSLRDARQEHRPRPRVGRHGR